MFRKVLFFTGAVLGLSTAGSAAVSIGGGGCSSDLTLTAGSSLVNCYGRFSGNSLNNASNADIASALTALGYTGPAITYGSLPSSSILSNLNGSTTVDFSELINGTAYVGIHYGNGQGGPGNSTTFYAINASNLDKIKLNLNASSTATLFAVVPGAVPEPASWALMVGGFGLLGATMRRRRSTAVRFS